MAVRNVRERIRRYAVADMRRAAARLQSGEKNASSRSSAQIAATKSHASIAPGSDESRTVSDQGSEGENAAVEDGREAVSASPTGEGEPPANSLRRSKRRRGDQSASALMAHQKRARETTSGIMGVYEKKGLMEAHLDVTRLKEIIDVQHAIEIISSSGKGSKKAKPELVYIGQYFFTPSDMGREQAVQQCDLANTRAALKLIEALEIDPSAVKDKLIEVFPQAETLISGDEKEHRQQFESFDAYILELRGELKRPSGKVWGVTERRAKGGTTFEARYSRTPGLKSFGNYSTKDEAITSFDIGTILAYGPHEKSLNRPLTRYMMDGKLREEFLQIPSKVRESVQHYLHARKDTGHLSTDIERISSYFPDSSCPFYDPSAT